MQLPITREELIVAVADGQTFSFLFFWGHRKPPEGGVSKSCFSQWYESAFQLEGERFRTAEHYMMWRKARLFGDEEIAKKIVAAASPGEAKSLGRKVRGFSEPEWLAHRESIVVAGNLAKFSQNLALRRFLVGTEKQILVEASPVDTIWGIGLSQDDERATQPSEWPGLNLLGFALMRTREDLAKKIAQL